MENPIGFSKFVGDVGKIRQCTWILQFKILKSLLCDPVTQGLIRSSRPEMDNPDLKKYSSLWSDLMNFSRHVNLPLTLETHVSVTEHLDQQLIASLSSIIKRLNFEIEGTEKSLEMEDTGKELLFRSGLLRFHLSHCNHTTPCYFQFISRQSIKSEEPN